MWQYTYNIARYILILKPSNGKNPSPGEEPPRARQAPLLASSFASSGGDAGKPRGSPGTWSRSLNKYPL